MSDALAMQLTLISQSPECLEFRLALRNTSGDKLLVPRPAINCLRFGNMATGKEAPWRTRWLDSAHWAGFVLDSGEVQTVNYLVRPCSVPRPTTNTFSEYARCCVDLFAAGYLVWLKFEVNQDYVCSDSHYRYADLVWDALCEEAVVWTGIAMSDRLNVAWS